MPVEADAPPASSWTSSTPSYPPVVGARANIDDTERQFVTRKHLGGGCVLGGYRLIRSNGSSDGGGARVF